MNEWTIWLIVAVFYLPVHSMPPLLIALVRASGSDARRLALRLTTIDCVVSAAAGLALAVWFGLDKLNWAIGALVMAFPLPYLRFILAPRGRGGGAR